MTKTHYREILQELKNIRTTNKFNSTNILFLPDYFSKEKAKEIIKVDVENLVLYFSRTDYLTYDHVISISPQLLRKRFSLRVNPLNIDKILWK
jgi:hypothetical protein